jgi:hypothetical protein
MFMDLERWLSIPRSRSNLASVATTAAFMALIVFRYSGPDPVMVIREIAMLMALMHSLLHFIAIRGLSTLMRRGVPLARQASEAYCDPLRVSHLDLAAAWGGLFVLTPYVVAESD